MLNIEFKALPHTDPKPLKSLISDLHRMHCQANLSTYCPTGALARLDWLLPTGVTIELIKPFYETQVQSSDEAFVTAFRNWVENQLYQAMIKAETPFQLMNKDGTPKHTIFTMHCSLVYTLKKGEDSIKLKLMLPMDCSAQYFSEAVFSFMQMLEDIFLAQSEAVFFDMLKKTCNQGYGTRVLWYNQDIGRTEFVDVEKSQKTNTVIKQQIA